MIRTDLSLSNDSWRDPQLLTALIVDVHSFSAMCADPRAEGMARFIRDVFAGAVDITERHNGLVANTMGDGILCLFESVDAAFTSALKIVKDFGDQHEYLARHKSDFNPEPYVDLGLRCRCSLETGLIEHHPLSTEASGTFTLWIGNAINYAARINNFEERVNTGPGRVFNTIVVGPAAYETLRNLFTGFLPPIQLEVKNATYVAYPFDTVDLYDE